MDKTTRMELDSLISKCVRRNIKFPGLMNSFYSVQNFFDGTVSLKTLQDIGNNLNQKLHKLTKEDLFGTTEGQPTLELQIQTIVAVHTYLVDKMNRAKQAAETKKNNLQKASLIREVLAEKELGSLKSTSKSRLEAMLAELES